MMQSGVGNDVVIGRMGFFFFSSRRRHTRFDCDWSSDVCSSDLAVGSQHRSFDPDIPLRLSEGPAGCGESARQCAQDRKSTRLNSSHSQISYAVFCLKKKTATNMNKTTLRQDSRCDT